MLFNRLKWWNIDNNADKTTINGRNYVAIPEEIKIPNDTNIETTSSSVNSSLGEQTVRTIGRTIDDRYVFYADNFKLSTSPNLGISVYGYAFVKCADVTPIWGVNAS
ncbi:hypothetical protein [Lactobacillus sp. A27]|uniref:hypothetical protein n=1 Tax=Lactobacillus sp. A27 TaxID=2796363 RepID=UPI00191E4736|nr:hypothetical protein [Lactobacillus sp. A27]MBL1059526.1 hypothetical protein [Lactobacillus sp. A27]